MTLFLSVVSLVSCDHTTKGVASQLDGSMSVIPNVLELTYAENHDVAFNLLRWISPEIRSFLIVGIGFLSVMLLGVLWRLRSPQRFGEHMAFVFLIGGAVGNLIDRVFRGYVVDFIYFHGWPVFNAADAFIVAGVVLFLVTMRRPRRNHWARSYR